MNLKERLLLLTLTAVNFTHIMDFMIMMPLGPQLMVLFDITPQQFGFAVSAYAITAGCAGFASAFFVDRFDRKSMLLFAYIGFVAGTFSCAFAPTYGLLVAARVLAGLFGGMIGAQVMSIVSDTFEYERRGRAMGSLMTAFSLASVIGVPGGLWLAARYSWHAPFLVVGGLGVLIVGMIVALVPPMTKHLTGMSNVQQGMSNPDEKSGQVVQLSETSAVNSPSPEATTSKSAEQLQTSNSQLQTSLPAEARSAKEGSPFQVLTNIAQSPRQQWALVFSAVLMVGHFSIIPYIAPTLVGNVGYSQDNIFLIYLVGGLLTIFTSPLVGRLADRKGKYPVFAVFAVLSLIPVWIITHLWPSPLWAVLCVAGMFFIFTNGRMVPMQAMVSNVVPPQQRGGFMSINSSVQQLASGLAATIGGAIIVKTADGRIEHYGWVGYLAMALILTSVFLAKKVVE